MAPFTQEQKTRPGLKGNGEVSSTAGSTLEDPPWDPLERGEETMYES